MKNALKFLSLTVALGALIFTTSCGEDDGGGIIIDGGDGGSFLVGDGLYIASIAASDTTVAVGNKLNSTKVEADGFGTQDRSGHQSGYMFLEAGSYVFLEVDDQKAAQAYGGSATTYNDDDADNTDDYTGGYSVVDLSGSVAPFAVANSGFYHVIFDQQTNEALMVEIASYGAIGGAVFSDACSSDGFNADIDMTQTSASADGAEFTGEGIILKGAEFKVRYNDSWKIDRRSDKSSFDAANGYVSLCNLGGTLTALEEGGANISLGDNSIADATYDITLAFDENGTPAITLTSVGDAPVCSFDAANFTWGIIGGGTQGTEATAGWNADKKLIYTGQDGSTHTWRGVFPISGAADNNMFKFRTDDTWATKLLPTNVNFTNNADEGTITDDGATNADGQWFVADGKSGFFYIVITTSDNGTTWNMTIDEAEFQLIGEGSPVGNWDSGNGQAMTYGDDLSSSSGSGAFTTAGWKIFVNQSFDYNLGGALDGTTALLFNADTFTLGSDGTYTITISTADGGVNYTATAAQ